jgi:hypothetical protein
MVNLLGETNAPTKPRTSTSTTSTENLDVFVSGVPSTPKPKTTPKTIASDLMDSIAPKPKAPTPTPIIPQDTTDVLDAYGNPKTEEQTCPEGYTKNYNRQGKLECLPNYNDKPDDCGSPTMCTEDEEFVDCKCQKKTPSTSTPTQVTKNLKPLIYGVGIIVGIIIVSKLLKSTK